MKFATEFVYDKIQDFVNNSYSYSKGTFQHSINWVEPKNFGNIESKQEDIKEESENVEEDETIEKDVIAIFLLSDFMHFSDGDQLHFEENQNKWLSKMSAFD